MPATTQSTQNTIVSNGSQVVSGLTENVPESHSKWLFQNTSQKEQSYLPTMLSKSRNDMWLVKPANDTTKVIKDTECHF